MNKNSGVMYWILLNKNIVDDGNEISVELLGGRERRWCRVLKGKKKKVLNESTIVDSLRTIFLMSTSYWGR